MNMWLCLQWESVVYGAHAPDGPHANGSPGGPACRGGRGGNGAPNGKMTFHIDEYVYIGLPVCHAR